MATITINSSSPSTTINLATLLAVIDKVLEASRRNSPLPALAPDEYQLLNEIRFAVTTGLPSSTNTVSAVQMTYT